MKNNAILLVDDDIDDQLLFSEAVSSVAPGYERVIKSDGIEALDYLTSAEKLPELIFLDLNMPRMNGVECLKALKKNNRLAVIPVVILSTFKSDEKAKELEKLGASHYIQKPVGFKQFCTLVNGVLTGDYKDNN